MNETTGFRTERLVRLMDAMRAKGYTICEKTFYFYLYEKFLICIFKLISVTENWWWTVNYGLSGG